MSEALAGGRALAESRMCDTFAVYAPNGTAELDRIVSTSYAARGHVPGRLAGPSSRSSDPQATAETTGDSQTVEVEAALHVPVWSPAPVAGGRGVGWEYVVTATGPDTDHSLLGTRWLVVEAPAKSTATARRLTVHQVQPDSVSA